MIRILIADDHAVVRRGLVEILQAEPDMELAGEAVDASTTLGQVGALDPDVVLLDITMPGSSGLTVLTDIKAMRPDLPVLMVSMHREDEYAMRAIKAGAMGYLNKASSPEELVVAIRKVVAGKRYITPTLAQQLARGLAEVDASEPHESLSDREYEVFTMIASGKSPSEIAAELSISVKTVSTYRSRVLEKLDLDGTAELIRYAVVRGLAD